ncbi:MULTISPECIES: SasC/FmtB family protein, partial [Streptococcus]|uniref:SasC/FmtB family protein n=1 Tax=Streptococcus TaxID=1301 RepID=UPI0011066F62
MENNHSMSRVERSRREKVTRYSIRKVSFGAASVAVAAFFMFLGNGAVYAAEPNATATNSARVATPANKQLDENPGASDSTAPKAQADTTTSKPADATPAPVVSSTTSATEEKSTEKNTEASSTAPKAQADATTSKPADATPAPVVSSTTSATEEKSTKKNTEASSTEANSVENKEQTTVKAEEPSTTSAETTKPAEETATTESNKPKSRKKRALDANDQNRSGDAATTDEDDDPSVNAKNIELINPYFEANGTPTKEEKFKVIDSFDLIGWHLTNPNQTKVVIANGMASSFRGHGSVVDQTHPYGIPLALYTKKNDPSSKSDKFGGVYQDIDVKPGQEIVIGQNTTSFGGYGASANRTKLTVSYPEKGNQEQANLIWRPLVAPYSGVFTVPKGVTKIRVRLEAGPDNISQDDSSKIEIDGQTYYVGSMVSKLSITTGADVVAQTPTVKYNEVSPSATAKTVRTTISVDLVNEGHAYSANNKYSVKLPDNATYVSSEGGTAANVKDGTLSINYKSLAPGEKKTLTYTVDLPADKASSTDFNGINTWKTNTAFNGLEGTVVGGTVIGTPGAKVRNIPVKPQNVTVNMYKTDLEKKVNGLETKLAQLNESDYTPESWKAMQDQLAEAKNILNEEKNNVPVADRKNQAEINAKLVLLEKEKAKLDLEKAAKDQITKIEAVDGSVKEEKEAAKAKLIETLAAAKKAVDSATTEADVTTKLTEETNKITPILPAEEVKTAAKNDIQSILEEKKTQIAARDELTTEEKEAAVKEAERLAQDAKNRVDAATTQESVELNKDRGEEKVEKVDPAAKVKPAAKAAIDAALKAQEKAIDAKPDSTKEEKEAAKEEAIDKAEAAKEAIDKAASNGDVTTAKEAGVGTITPVEPKAEVKPAAKQAIEDAYKAKVEEIEKRPELTTEEKAAAKAEARKLADAAKANVDKAKTDDAVATAEDKGTTKVADVDPAAKAKPAAKAAIDAALKEKEKAIDAKPDSTKEEKEAAKEEARAKAEAAKEAIDKADSNADVTAAKDAGVGTITPVEPKAEVKPAAKQAIEDAYTAKVEEIEARPDLTTEEKEAAKAEAKKAADDAKANVAKAKTDDAVATAKDSGTTKVDNVNPVAKAKPAAKAAIDAALKAQEKAIDAKPDSTKEEKEAAKEEARAKAEAAKEAIDKAASNGDVTTAKETGVETIKPVEPKAEVKPAAKQAIEDAYKAKVEEIEARPDLTTEEKAAAKEEARKIADAAKANVDKAKTDDAVAAAEDKGTTKVADVDPVAKAKPAAKAAIDAALKAQEKAIDAKPDSTKEEKEAAKEEARAKAEAAKESIDKADSNANVAAAKEAGVGTITPVEPKAEVKPAAKQAIEDAYTAKVAEIEKRPELTTEEKTAAKEEARKLADAAKENVDKAKTDDAVATAEEKGTTKVDNVNPVAKAKPAAKAAVDAALAEKDKAIDANDKLSDAEKAAAKEEAKKAADEAKKAIDEAKDQAGVDAKATEGTAAVAAVNPVGKEKAKAAVDAALAEKDKAIDANDKLSDA